MVANGSRWWGLRERHHRRDDAARGALRVAHDHLAIPRAREEARLEDHGDRHRMERVLIAAEIEGVIVPHAASGGWQAWYACRLSVTSREQRCDLGRAAGGVSPGRRDTIPGGVGVVAPISMN